MSDEFKIVDDLAPEPKVQNIFGGRLVGSEFKRLDDGKNRETLHVVHLDLIMNTQEYRAFLDSMDKQDSIQVLMVRQ